MAYDISISQDDLDVMDTIITDSPQYEPSFIKYSGSSFPLLFGVYDESGELVKVARVLASDLFKLPEDLDFNCSDFGDEYLLELEFCSPNVTNLALGIPVLSKPSFILHEDNTFSIDSHATIFLPILNNSWDIKDLIVFRVLFSTDEHYPVAELNSWFGYLLRNKLVARIAHDKIRHYYEKIRQGAPGFINVSETKDNNLEIFCHDRILHLSDSLEMARIYETYKYSGIALDSSNTLVLADDSPSRICYIPELHGKFTLDIPPHVGEEGIMLGKTYALGHLKITSNPDQNRLIRISDSSVRLVLEGGNVDVEATGSDTSYCSINSVDLLNAKFDTYMQELNFGYIKSGTFVSKQKINTVDMWNTKLKSFSADSVGTCTIKVSSIEEPIQLKSAGSIILKDSNVTFTDLVAEEFDQMGNNLALGHDSTLISLTLRDVRITQQHRVHGINMLAIGNGVEFSYGSLTLFPRIQPDIKGDLCARLELLSALVISSKDIKRGVIPLRIYNFIVDLTEGESNTLCIGAAHILINKMVLSFIANVLVKQKVGIPATVILEMPDEDIQATVFDTILAQIGISDDITFGFAELDISALRKSYEPVFEMFRLHNPDVALKLRNKTQCIDIIEVQAP